MYRLLRAWHLLEKDIIIHKSFLYCELKIMTPRLNFHHLQYFWAVAKNGNLTRTAASLRVSQSALSAQIRLLEGELGEPLFARKGRRLELTEAGRIALEYADDIFATGGELVTVIAKGRRHDDAFRMGAVATLSRNLQESFVKPLLGRAGVTIRLQSGGLDELMDRLDRHDLDVVLSNRPMRGDAARRWRCRRIARQPVSIVGRPELERFRFPADVETTPMLLPGPQSEIRSEFDALCERRGAKAKAIAEVDDMAMLRLLARDMAAPALVPSVVVRDELGRGQLVEHCVVPSLFETFYAITVDRHYQHPLLRVLLMRGEQEILAMGEPRTASGSRPQRRRR